MILPTGAHTLQMLSTTEVLLYLPLQAVHGAATSDGVGTRGRGSHGAQAQLLRGQRRCSAGRQVAAARSGLRAPPAPVRLYTLA